MNEYKRYKKIAWYSLFASIGLVMIIIFGYIYLSLYYLLLMYAFAITIGTFIACISLANIYKE